jgi:hypothetical protein
MHLVALAGLAISFALSTFAQQKDAALQQPYRQGRSVFPSHHRNAWQ